MEGKEGIDPSLWSAGTRNSAPAPPRIKLGLVGLNFGWHILTELLETNARESFVVKALCDRDPGRLSAAAQRVEADCYSSLDNLLADPEVEAVGLFTHPVGRMALMRQIVESGRHVLTTKPLGLDAAGMLHLLRSADAAGRMVHCNSPGPLPTEEMKIVQGWMREYQLGAPVGARAQVWVSYQETPDGSWYDDPEACPAAPIYRLGVYSINDLVRLFGRVASVQVMQSRLFTQRPTPDNAQVGLLFENGAVGNIYASFCVNDGDKYRNSLVLNFQNGTIYRNAGPAWSLAPGVRSRLALVQKHAGEPRVVADAFAPIQSGDYQWSYFAQAIRGERRPDDLRPEEMVEGIRVMKAIFEAVRNGGVAQVAH